jgi:cobalamin-dependent methionine synthase I
MLIIGERINTCRQSVMRAYAERDAGFIRSLSVISFGLPERKLLHCAFLPILMHEGLDAIFLDPADQRLMATFRAARTILGQDECCMQYIASHRDGGLANGGEGLRRDDKENMR